MPRLSPITIGVAILAAAVLMATVYLVMRPETSTLPSVPVELLPVGPSAARPPAPPAPAPPPRVPLGARASTPPAVPNPSAGSVIHDVVPPPLPPPLDAAAQEPPVDRALAVIQRKRDAMMTRQHLRAIRAADEQVFDSLKLPEPTRVAIRQLNDQAAKTREQSAAAGAQAAQTEAQQTEAQQTEAQQTEAQIVRGLTNDDQAERTRRAGLEDLLGAQGSKDFAAAEFSAARRFRRGHRAELFEELQKEAPLPEMH